MATLHGKDSVVYMSPGTGDAVPISEAAEWSIDVDADQEPDPALQDEWETQLRGLKRFSGSFSGNFDDAQDTLFSAATANTPSAFYLYPDTGTAANFYSGNIWPKVSISGGVTSKENFSVDFVGDGELFTAP